MSLSLTSLIRQRPTPEVARALLLALYDLFAFERTKGQLALERHVDDPHGSEIFQRHAALGRCPWLLEPLIDVLRHRVFGMSELRVVGDVLQGVVMAEERDLAAIRRGTAALLIITGALGAAALGWWPLPLTISVFALLVVVEAVAWLAVAAIADHRLGLLRALRLAVVHHCDGYAPQVAAEIARQALPRWLRPTHHAFVTATLTDSERANEGSGEDNVLAVLRDISKDVPPAFVDPALAFNCLSLLDDLDLAGLLRRVDKDKVAIALLGASPGMVLSIFSRLGSRVRPLLGRDMIERRGAPVTDILAAQKEIAALAASLMRSGDIAPIGEVLERMADPKEKELQSRQEIERLLAEFGGPDEEGAKR